MNAAHTRAHTHNSLSYSTHKAATHSGCHETKVNEQNNDSHHLEPILYAMSHKSLNPAISHRSLAPRSTLCNALSKCG